MVVSLVLPVSYDGGDRQASLEWLRPMYPSQWERVEAPGPSSGAWSKGAQVNAGVQASRGGVLIIADADLLIDLGVLIEAVNLVAAGAPWVMPHGIVYRLSRGATMAVRSLKHTPTPTRVISRRHPGPVGGGFVVCSRSAFDAVHGIDPRFTGWGGEDISFGRALDTLVGRHVRLDAPTWHLWHEPLPRVMGRRASPENERLAGRYLDAAGDEVAMRALCEEH